MAIKLFIVILISKVLIKVLRILGLGGTTLPGKIALKLYPGIINSLSSGFKVIMVTGTNGKTTTSRIIGSILAENKIPYIANRSGANLVSGVTTTFIEAVSVFQRHKADTALIEIDEAAFSSITRHIKPDVLVVTNFFRDQLDRYGELYSTLGNVVSGIKKTTATLLVLNADDSLCSSIAKDTNKPAIFFGMDSPVLQSDNKNSVTNSDAPFCIYCKTRYDYDYIVYSHLGKYKCPKCGYERPSVDISCTEIIELSDSYSKINLSLAKNSYSVNINLPGLYNIYNALAAASCAHALGLPEENTVNALGAFDCGFGRMETIKANDIFIKVILVKNPAGFNQVIDFLLTRDKNMGIIFAINDNLADGTDVSWLWDVDFEKLKDLSGSIDCLLTCGTRGEDMALRLKYAGIDPSIIKIYGDYAAVLDKAVSSCPKGHTLYILPTYTAMLQIRKLLRKKYGLKEFWK